MLKLTYDEKVHLDKWDIDVKPYLTIDQIDLIYDMAKNEPNHLLRERIIMANVLVACTDLYSTEDDNYTYEEILYSGLWDDILNACPYICKAIVAVKDAITEHNSIENTIIKAVNQLTNSIKTISENFDKDKIEELIPVLNGLKGE
jgi:hypothetical protein